MDREDRAAVIILARKEGFDFRFVNVLDQL